MKRSPNSAKSPSRSRPVAAAMKSSPRTVPRKSIPASSHRRRHRVIVVSRCGKTLGSVSYATTSIDRGWSSSEINRSTRAAKSDPVPAPESRILAVTTFPANSEAMNLAIGAGVRNCPLAERSNRETVSVNLFLAVSVLDTRSTSASMRIPPDSIPTLPSMCSSLVIACHSKCLSAIWAIQNHPSFLIERSRVRQSLLYYDQSNGSLSSETQPCVKHGPPPSVALSEGWGELGPVLPSSHDFRVMKTIDGFACRCRSDRTRAGGGHSTGSRVDLLRFTRLRHRKHSRPEAGTGNESRGTGHSAHCAGLRTTERRLIACQPCWGLTVSSTTPGLSSIVPSLTVSNFW